MSPSRHDCDVAIVGAGPTGSLLAAQLGRQGLRVILLERRNDLPRLSMAIGVTPPSLQILEQLGLHQELIQRGVKVRDVRLHGHSGELGTVTFRDLAGDYPFVLAVPQSTTVAMLRETVARSSNISLQTDAEVTDITQDPEGCTVSLGDRRIRARYVVGCDGSKSRVREAIQVPSKGKSYGVHFVMGDFKDRTTMGSDAHLYFLPDGSVESFPLPDGYRRWIVQTPEFLQEPPAGLIQEIVRQRAGVSLLAEDQITQSSFTPRRLNCERYHVGRVLLCGDAAHLMSPVGGQGMNTGFADVEFLSGALTAILQQGAAAQPLLEAYTRYRRKASQTAIWRAGASMWLGTWGGIPRSIVRDFIIRHLMCRGPLAPHMGPLYAMLTIPYNTLQRVPLHKFTTLNA